MTEQIDWREKRLGKSEVLRSLRHTTCGGGKSQGHHTFDRLEERGEERSSLRGRERAIVNQTEIGTVSMATLGKLSKVKVIETSMQGHNGVSNLTNVSVVL